MSNLMDELKERTRSIHDSAEGGDFQGLLMQGKLSREAYLQYLGQLFLLYGALEGEIQKHQKNGNSWSCVVTENQYQLPFLQTDLKHFGVQPETLKTLPPTKHVIDVILEVSKKSPVGLLGYHYVLLGSKHGSKMISQNIRNAYELSQVSGALYFDPYGSGFAEIWKKFKEDMNQLSLSQDDREAVCLGAISMFRSISALGDELLTAV
jgi:heme oxygenase